jgi:hypothetical protein
MTVSKPIPSSLEDVCGHAIRDAEGFLSAAHHAMQIGWDGFSDTPTENLRRPNEVVLRGTIHHLRTTLDALEREMLRHSVSISAQWPIPTDDV